MLPIAIGRCLRETDVSAPQQTEKKKNGLSCQVELSDGKADSPQPQEKGPHQAGRIIFETPFSPVFAPSTRVGVRPCLPHRQATERRAGAVAVYGGTRWCHPDRFRCRQAPGEVPRKKQGKAHIERKFPKGAAMAEPGAMDRIVFKECRAQGKRKRSVLRHCPCTVFQGASRRGVVRS